jgi:hypothetical protein
MRGQEPESMLDILLSIPMKGKKKTGHPITIGTSNFSGITLAEYGWEQPDTDSLILEMPTFL